jgi:hypothetical protein
VGWGGRISAISNLKAIVSPAAATLRTSCQLNLALCYVKIGQNDDAIATCTDVISDDPESLKATYRRGQAHLAKVRVRRARWVDAESSLGDAESSLGDAESSLGDAESSLGGRLELAG